VTEDALKQARILALDDDVATLCLLRGVLQRFGFTRIETVENPRRFAATFDRMQPDLVITDLVMPQLTGFEIIDYVRSVLPASAWLPVLVCTANDTAQSRRKALAAGATDIIVKPFDPSELLMRIRNVLRARFLHLSLAAHNEALERIVAKRTSDLEKALTELRASQRNIVQQERFSAFGEMASGVVHDFNNALMTIIGYSEIMLADPTVLADTVQVADYLGAINTAGRDASHIVSRLRDFYRPREQGDRFLPVELHAVIEESAKLTQPKWKTLAQSFGREIIMNLELERTPPIQGCAAELREVFTNLIFNAVDALPHGGTISLRTRSDGRQVQIEVADTGTGMTPEVRERCLEPFFSTKGDSGTGLGLATVFGIVKRHEGTLEIESAPGRGTTFLLRFPVCDPAGLGTGVGQAAPVRPLDVLLVDDEPNTRDVVSRYLAGDGHDVVAVANGAEALRTFQRKRFDLLLTDQGMPGMSGMQLARHIRAMQAEQPIVLLTGFSFDQEHLPPEINQVIRKPIAPDKLRAVLAEVVGG
jgi:signal transduction histidine kinase